MIQIKGVIIFRLIKNGTIFPWQHYLPRFNGYNLSLNKTGTPLRCAVKIVKKITVSELNRLSFSQG